MGLASLSARREKGWLAIVAQGSRFDLAHVVREGQDRPEIRLLESYRIESNEQDALERLRAARKLKTFRCVSLMAPGQYQFMQMDAPTVPLAERAEALRWQLKDRVDFPVDTAAIGVLDIPLKDGGAGRQASIFAVMASAQAVVQRMRLFSEARVPLDVIDVPELAQRNIAALFEEPNRGLAFLGLVDGDGLLTITYGGELYLARRIEVSAQSLAEATPERRQMLLERLVLELQRTLDNFDRQFNFISVARLVVAADHAVDGLMAALSENLYVPVLAMDLALVADFPALPELRNAERQAQCLFAVGAALRDGSV